MKKVILLIMVIVSSITGYSQTSNIPNQLNLVAVVRDNSGIPITTEVDVKLEISTGDLSKGGQLKYCEQVQNIQPNTHGEIAVQYGMPVGTNNNLLCATGTTNSLADGDWEDGNTYYRLSWRVTGQPNYSKIDSGFFDAVPYAFASRTAEQLVGNNGADSGEVLQWNGKAWVPGNVTGIGDNWGTQTVQTNSTLSGAGTSGSPLEISQQGATNGQVLKWNGSAWSPGTDNTGSGSSYTAGTGISISGNVISNSSPNQTVTLTGGGNTSVTGSYPNFTISSTGGSGGSYTAGTGINISGSNVISNIEPSITYTAGTGININGTQITNTAPDQTVNLTAGSGVTITGTYPNFTVSAPSSSGVPTGTIIAYAGTVGNPPAGWLVCDGSIVTVAQYQNLFDVINTYWGSGNGNGSDFNLPDLRGMFLRGVTGTSPNDPDATSRTATNGGHSGNSVGSVEQDDFKSHSHTSNDASSKSGGYNASGVAGSLWFNGTIESTTSSTGGNETRPKNAYVYYLIKY